MVVQYSESRAAWVHRNGWLWGFSGGFGYRKGLMRSMVCCDSEHAEGSGKVPVDFSGLEIRPSITSLQFYVFFLKS